MHRLKVMSVPRPDSVSDSKLPLRCATYPAIALIHLTITLSVYPPNLYLWPLCSVKPFFRAFTGVCLFRNYDGLATWRHKRERMLFILCGAGGMRIGEVLGVEIDKHLSPHFMTISLTQKVRHCKVEDRSENREFPSEGRSPSGDSLPFGRVCR